MVDWASRSVFDSLRARARRGIAATVVVGLPLGMAVAIPASQALSAPEAEPRTAVRSAASDEVSVVAATGSDMAVANESLGAGARSSERVTTSFQLIGHTGGASRAVVADAGSAWIGEGVGISLLDISDPDDIRRIGHHVVAADSDVWSLARYGQTLYAGCSRALHAFDISDPSSPKPIARYDSPGALRALAVYAPPGEETHWLLATDDQVGVRVYAVDPEGTIDLVSDLPGTMGATSGAALEGTTAVVPGDDALLFDISDPTAPMELGRIRTAGRVKGVAATGGWVFVADTDDGLLVTSLTDPLVPVARLPHVGAGRLFVRGPSLYVLEEHGAAKSTVRLIDITDPSDPSDVLGGESTYSVLRGATDLAPVGNALMAARGHMVTLADVTDRYWPEVASEEHVTWPLTGLSDAGSCFYAARGEPGMDVLAVANPGSPVREAAWRPPGGTAGTYYHEGYVYVSDAAGFGRFDASSPCEPVPREIPFAPHWAPTRWISAHGTRLVATTPLELYVADLRGDDFPRERARVRYTDLRGWPAGAVAKDIVLADSNLAYVAAGNAGTAVIALDDPAAPVVRRVEPSPEGLDVQAVDVHELLLAAGSTDGVLLYDLSDPLAPRLGVVALRGLSAVGLDLGEGWLHVAADMDGLHLLDVTRPSHPVEIAALAVPYSVSAVVAAGQRVYAAGAGLLVLELAEVPEPTPTATRSPEPVTPTVTPSAVPTDVPTVEPTPTWQPTATRQPDFDGPPVLLPLVLR